MTQIAVEVYKGWQVHVSTHDGRFTATDQHPQEGHERPQDVTLHSETLEKLRKSIDTKENRKKKAKAITLSLPIANKHGSGTITGISLHNDSYLGEIPKDERGYGGNTLYVDTPWVRELLALIKELEEKAHALRRVLAIAEIKPISSSWNGGTGVSVKHDGDYAEAVADLRERYAKALLAAEEAAERETEEAQRARPAH